MDTSSSTYDNLVGFNVETTFQYLKDFTWKVYNFTMIIRDKTLTW